MTFRERTTASGKWRTPLKRETERKIYFFSAMGMLVYWTVSLVL